MVNIENIYLNEQIWHKNKNLRVAQVGQAKHIYFYTDR